MELQKIEQIFADTAYVRTGGSEEELKCAQYLQKQCAEMGLAAVLDPFEVEMARNLQAKLVVDGKEIRCKGYLCAGSGEVEGELYYLPNTDPCSLKQCKGKIIMIDGYLGYWIYQDILENGAVGFITYDGNANYTDCDIDQRELRSYVSKGNKIPGVNINVKDAIALIRENAAKAKIFLSQEEYKGESRNVMLELPGTSDEWIVLTAHYDSTSLSTGAYDNMSGSLGLLMLAEYFKNRQLHYGLRFLWCGSEERGLLGSKAYCAAHEEELKKVVLNVNLDMIGCIMGKFIACCTAEEKLVSYIQYLASELGFGMAARDGVYSSDSTPFADKGVPAVSFARSAPGNTATIHNRYDTLQVMKAGQMVKDFDFVKVFVERMANAAMCPVSREIPEKMKEKLDIICAVNVKTKADRGRVKNMKIILSDAESVKKDAEELSYSRLSVWENGSREIKMSLQLDAAGEWGSKISWKSSDPKFLTNGGRVIRPRWYQEDAQVTMSAAIQKGDCTAIREFDFVVLKDEEWADPQFLPDEEFFGVFKDGVWITESKLDYSLPGLSGICEAAKCGEYALAKAHLQKYFAARKPMGEIDRETRNTLWANALVDDFYHLQSGIYFQGDVMIGSEWGTCEATVGLQNIPPGGVSCFGVRSWYNEYSQGEIKRYNDENKSCRPKIELVVNGETRVYDAIEDAMARAGAYKGNNYCDSRLLQVQTFGEFLGDDTRHAYFKFDFADLKAEDQVTSAKLLLTARVYPAFAGEKRLIIVKEPVNTWDGKTAVWQDFGGYVYSYNGLPGKNDWINKPEGSDIEYWYQMCRFYGYHNAIIPEYLATKDETYMYKMLSILNDYLCDTGNYTMCDTITYDPNGVRGGFTRSLDAAIKNFAFMKMVEVIAGSPTTTPEIFTAFLKSIWDTTNYLTIHHTRYNNWRQTEFQAVLEASIKMPEFCDALHGRNWRSLAVKTLEEMLFLNNLPDGSYREATCGYSFGAFKEYVKHKIRMKELGITVSEEYDRLLHKCAYYIAMLFAPNGRTLQYGDEGAGTANLDIFRQVCDWYGDEELAYIVSRGKCGRKPDWTSRHWSDSTVTVMRADWSEESPYLFTNVRGGGAHGHRDYNGVIVYAYGRMLLNDAGIFTYTGTDPYRRWGTSTVAHNSVVINDGTQIHVETAGLEPTGRIHEWVTDASFDFLSQSTPNYPGFEHRRSILFIKPKMWIISDRILPENSDAANNYKQTWHMLPSAGLRVSEEKNTIYSTWPDGANVIVASADGADAVVKTEMGYYDQSYQQLQNAPYGYFEKNGRGSVSFDTVIMPIKEDADADLVVQKLETAEHAAALKLTYTLNGTEYTGSYYISDSRGGGSFGKYTTDGQVAYVEENKEGQVTYFMILHGSCIQNMETGACLIPQGGSIKEEVLSCFK